MSGSSIVLRRSRSILQWGSLLRRAQTVHAGALSLQRFSSTSSGFGLPPLSSYLGGNHESLNEEEQRFEQAEAKRQEFRTRKGRGWSDPWDMEEMLDANIQYESLPDWAPHHVSRISQERVQLFTRNDNDGPVIPTLSEIAKLSNLPTSPVQQHHPAENAALYALQRKRGHYQHIATQVQALAAPKIVKIRRMSEEAWEQKQEAVDILFEELEFTLREQEPVLGRHPQFGAWVERALEEYLRKVQKEDADETSDTVKKQEEAHPIFMDVFLKDKDSKDEVIPSILHPMKPSPRKETIGRMVEEWELAALKTSRRIMIRECTRKIANTMIAPTPARILVHGREGIGKSATLAAIVASARSTPDTIVLYLPDGDHMHRNSFYCEPNERRPGLFDLPVLQQQVCTHFLTSHKDQLINMRTDASTMERFMTESQLADFTKDKTGGDFSLVDVLDYGVANVDVAGPCCSAVIDVLMTQDVMDFVVVVDEFNCFLQKSLYYHEAYDPEVKKSIPHSHMTLLKPFMDAVGVTAAALDSEDEQPSRAPVLMKRGCIVVGTTESHAVRRTVTDNFLRNAKSVVANDESSLVLVQVPRLSRVEVEHMVANYEATGVGKLRLDKGETVMNAQEMEFLRMVSGGEPLKLMNACML